MKLIVYKKRGGRMVALHIGRFSLRFAVSRSSAPGTEMLEEVKVVSVIPGMPTAYQKKDERWN